MTDLHSHREPPYPEGVLSFRVGELPEADAFPGQVYSAGFHPWDFPGSGFPGEADYAALERALARPDVVAAGECGIDIPKGGLLAFQRIAFARQAELAEKARKPLIIHCVKAHDHIIAMRRDLKPAVNWAIHGFRSKPSIAKMLLDAGLWLSFGPQFNAESVRITPRDRLLAETDESGRPIAEVIAALSEAYGEPLEETIATNLRRFLQP